jgi:uncharacterized HhH-GPD family protein
MENVVKADNLDSWELSREVGDFLLNNPNAVLFGAIFDYLVPYKRAWIAPFELHRRLGHLDPFRLAKMTESRLLPYFQRGKYGQALHRFPPTLTRRIIAASKKLVKEYKGNASNIWPNGTSASVVMERLDDFEGISQKISRMMGRLLGTYFGVSLTKWNKIDVAVDRHVARVFLRTGLVDRRRGVYSVAEVKDEVIQCARELKPSFPGCLDAPAFDIGINWCTAEKAYCGWEKEPCPLHNTCMRRIHTNTK